MLVRKGPCNMDKYFDSSTWHQIRKGTIPSLKSLAPFTVNLLQAILGHNSAILLYLYMLLLCYNKNHLKPPKQKHFFTKPQMMI